jgi:glycosyltransferase involved in cell wall biosynthesis
MTETAEPRTLRVLHLARSYPNNVLDTLGTWTAWPVRTLAARCEVRVVSPVPWCPPAPHVGPLRQYTRFRQVAREEVRDGVRVHHPRFVIGPASTVPCLEHRSYARAVRPLADRLRREFPFDVVHAHFAYADGVVAAELAERYGVPFLVTDQAPWYPWLERDCVREAVLPAARAAARLVCVSEFLRSTMRRYLPADVRVDVIPNGVDADAFSLARPGERKRDQIAYVGLINFNKGIDVLLEAMVRVARANERARLVLVGGSYYRNTRLQEDRLKERAQELGLGACVDFVGRRRPDEVSRYMRESGVVVLPSRVETFGAVLVEALASGTPVVATESGGPQEIVTDEVGRLVPTEDPDALAGALLDVLAHGDSFPPERLRRFAVERYSWSSVADRYLDLYRSVLAA